MKDPHTYTRCLTHTFTPSFRCSLKQTPFAQPPPSPIPSSQLHMETLERDFLSLVGTWDGTALRCFGGSVCGLLLQFFPGRTQTFSWLFQLRIELLVQAGLRMRETADAFITVWLKDLVDPVDPHLLPALSVPSLRSVAQATSPVPCRDVSFTNTITWVTRFLRLEWPSVCRASERLAASLPHVDC